MKKIIVLMIFMMLGSSLASAKVVFDLHAQHFSETFKGDMTPARYDTGDAYASTNLNYVSGNYTTNQANDFLNGYFNVDIKEPIANWSATVDVDYMLGSFYKRNRTVTLTSENGESVIVGFKYAYVTFNSETVYTPQSSYTHFTVNVMQNGNNIELYINGAAILA